MVTLGIHETSLASLSEESWLESIKSSCHPIYVYVPITSLLTVSLALSRKNTIYFQQREYSVWDENTMHLLHERNKILWNSHRIFVKHLENPCCFSTCSDDVRYSFSYSQILVHFNPSITTNASQEENAVLPTNSKTSSVTYIQNSFHCKRSIGKWSNG